MDSQASKQVDWCLKKAEKELEECKKTEKKLKRNVFLNKVSIVVVIGLGVLVLI